MVIRYVIDFQTDDGHNHKIVFESSNPDLSKDEIVALLTEIRMQLMSYFECRSINVRMAMRNLK